VRRSETSAHPLPPGALRWQIRPETLEPGLLRYSRAAGFSGDFGPELREALRDTTQMRWTLEEVPDGGAPTLVEKDEAEQASAAEEVLAHPLVAAAFAAFPHAEIMEDGDTPQAGSRSWRREA